MKERTEEDILSKAPITIVFGTSKYDIKPLTILKAREWRNKLVDTMNEVVHSMDAENTNVNVGPALTAALVGFPDKVAELVFAWSPDLNKEQVLAEATEEQMCTAFSAVMIMAYPFLAPLVLSMKVTKSQLK